jgi:phospholipid-binding lipoprotein MlaA
MTSFTIRLTWALRRGMMGVVAAAFLSALGGCASGPNANPRDPFEPFNRHVMQFNEGLDAVALKPAATVYRTVLPPLVRTGVNNFFSNLGDLWSSVNSALQLKFMNAGEDILRFNFNTFFGFGGILDIASELNIERHKEDFGQTLGRWRVPAGPYLVLPFFGPSTVRDALALPLDRKADPLHYVEPWETRYSLYVLEAVDIRSNLLRASAVLDEAALDKYSFTRDAYLQRRRAEIFENRPSDTGGREPKADGEAADEPGKIPPLDEPVETPLPGSGKPAPDAKP